MKKINRAKPTGAHRRWKQESLQKWSDGVEKIKAVTEFLWSSCGYCKIVDNNHKRCVLYKNSVCRPRGRGRPVPKAFVQHTLCALEEALRAAEFVVDNIEMDIDLDE